MEFHGRVTSPQSEGDTDLRRGPWTIEEDIILMNYITNHGEGRWNALARCAGLKRTGKSCRLRWLNYLRPDVRRGNITPEEQLLILELHSRWGNRWSKIAQYLPGRTDNEIKNYWRTRVQKHAKQLKCDVNSQQFKDVMRYLWMPRLLERIEAASANKTTAVATATAYQQLPELPNMLPDARNEVRHPKPSPESGSMAGSSSEYTLGTPISPSISISDCFGTQVGDFKMEDSIQTDQLRGWWPEMLPSPTGYCHLGLPEFDQSSTAEGINENLWSLEDIWSLQHQL